MGRKKMKKVNKAYAIYRKPRRETIYTSWEFQKQKREREKGVRNLFKEIIAENFQIMGGIWTSGS